MVVRLVALRDEAEQSGNDLLAYLIDVAVTEAERLTERPEIRSHIPPRPGEE